MITNRYPRTSGGRFVDVPAAAPAKFDPVAAWTALSPAAKDRAGAAAMLIAYTAAVAAEVEKSAIGFVAAEFHARGELLKRLPQIAIAAGREPPLPDLAALDVIACRVCGCTDEFACPDRCHWVEPDLCSACAAKIRLVRPW